jgi:hypothetical protein
MKYLLFLLLISAQSQAQPDTAKMNIRLIMKQKHVALAINYFSPIADAKLSDTLSTYLGSGLNPDSVVQVSWSVRRILLLHQRLSNENGGAGSWYREFMDATNVTFGFAGIRAQLNNRIQSGAQPSASIAAYILKRMEDWEAIQAAVVNERINSAKALIFADSDFD